MCYRETVKKYCKYQFILILFVYILAARMICSILNMAKPSFDLTENR